AVTSARTRRVEPPAGYTVEGGEPAFHAPGAKAEPPRYESVVVVRRMGDAVWPVDVELRFAGGKTVRRTWDGRERWIRYRVTGPALEQAVVDPDAKCLLEVNRLDNGMSVRDDPAPASAWQARLHFWAQNILELFALLGAVAGPS